MAHWVLLGLYQLCQPKSLRKYPLYDLPPIVTCCFRIIVKDWKMIWDNRVERKIQYLNQEVQTNLYHLILKKSIDLGGISGSLIINYNHHYSIEPVSPYSFAWTFFYHLLIINMIDWLIKTSLHKKRPMHMVYAIPKSSCSHFCPLSHKLRISTNV